MTTNYLVGEETKEKIFQVSTSLFYENGFTETTYNAISKAANVNRALIPYYFKKKQNLGLIIFNHFNAIFNQYCKKITKNESIELQICFYVFSSYRILENPNLARFVMQIKTEESLSNEMISSERHLFKDIIEKHNRITKKQFDILSQMDYGITKEAVRMIFYNNSASYIDQIASVELHLILGYCGYSKEEIDDIIKRTFHLLDQNPIHIGYDFEIMKSKK